MMCNIIDIKILICNQEVEYLRAVRKTLLHIGLRKIFTATSHKQIEILCKAQDFDLVLIDTGFNDTGGFVTGERLLQKFPDILVLYITDEKKVMDPIRSIFSGAVTFIVKHNEKDLEDKVSLWTDVATNLKSVREILHGGSSSPKRIYA